MALLRYTKLVTAVLLVTIQVTLSVKTNSRPVYEVVNEQSKSEERLIKTSGIANLPYGNPLAGNSQQNAKLHAHNQQAMFNAERVRQHKAQLQQQQRWLKTPQVVHNYLRAYHESQENQQLEIEQQQINDKKEFETTAKENETIPETKPERKRKHRSHGSEYQTILIPNNEIRPNIINDMAKIYKELNPIYYPTQSYQLNDIETLNSLLNKNPNEQLTEFNALIYPKVNVNHDKELETPIDLYFHLKGPSKSAENYPKYAIPIIQTHKEYIQSKEVSETPQIVQESYIEPVKNIQYVNTEISNIVNVGYNPLYQEEYEIKEEPRYQAENAEDNSERLHNVKSVRHLNKDGSSEPAYKNLKYAARYEFGYRVRDMHSGNDFGHQEEKNGEETNGQYHVLLPDGRMQNVRYSAGPEGFHADISYDGSR